MKKLILGIAIGVALGIGGTVIAQVSGTKSLTYTAPSNAAITDREGVSFRRAANAQDGSVQVEFTYYACGDGPNGARDCAAFKEIGAPTAGMITLRNYGRSKWLVQQGYTP